MITDFRELPHRYAAAIDDRRFDDVVALFAPDGELVVARPPEELDPVHRYVGAVGVRRAMDLLAAVPRTFHALVGEVYDGTSGRVACEAHHVTPTADGWRDTVWRVRYEDSYVEGDGGWLFGSRRLYVDMVETRPLDAARG